MMFSSETAANEMTTTDMLHMSGTFCVLMMDIHLMVPAGLRVAGVTPYGTTGHPALCSSTQVVLS